MCSSAGCGNELRSRSTVKMINLAFSGAGNAGEVDKSLKIISKGMPKGSTDTALPFALPM